MISMFIKLFILLAKLIVPYKIVNTTINILTTHEHLIEDIFLQISV